MRPAAGRFLLVEALARHVDDLVELAMLGRSGSAPGRRWSTFAVPIELGYLTECFFTSYSVALLDLSEKLIGLFLDDLPVIVGQSSPGFLELCDELLPVSIDPPTVHRRPLRH
jgi:hypothetical protein